MLDIALYYQIGIIGPAVATLFVYAIHASYMVWKGSKIIDLNVKDILPLRNIGNQLLRLIVPFGIGIAARIAISQLHLSVVIEFILIYAVYLLAVVAINFKPAIKLVKEINNLKLV